ncbi:MAG: hypothetical protein LBK71_07670 [Verrucomicrobiales bacterium]|nr:hypothetical protein [Verrucomicrobiales bacterium]
MSRASFLVRRHGQRLFQTVAGAGNTNSFDTISGSGTRQRRFLRHQAPRYYQRRGN